ncbi:hypothetical protein EV702DRAFT_1271373 [Suillus placidus]|uniref:Uncharacterized protein n=1 Tax=Suillus placidus TaxID=48579 RepID=A0A9P6ZKF0_9AGAM|nr:hypothetical protein EV702DRAFT_1271373 [Suillus placidus]
MLPAASYPNNHLPLPPTCILTSNWNIRRCPAVVCGNNGSPNSNIRRLHERNDSELWDCSQHHCPSEPNHKPIYRALKGQAHSSGLRESYIAVIASAESVDVICVGCTWGRYIDTRIDKNRFGISSGVALNLKLPMPRPSILPHELLNVSMQWSKMTKDRHKHNKFHLCGIVCLAALKKEIGQEHQRMADGQYELGERQARAVSGPGARLNLEMSCTFSLEVWKYESTARRVQNLGAEVDMMRVREEQHQEQLKKGVLASSYWVFDGMMMVKTFGRQSSLGQV